MEQKRAKREFQTHYFRPPGTQEAEVNDQPSMTVPDQEMTIPEMIRRFAAGLPVEGYEPLYDEDADMGEDLPQDFDHWDLADQEAYIGHVAAHVAGLKARLAREAEESKKNPSPVGDVSESAVSALDAPNKPSPASPARGPRRAAGGKSEPGEGEESTK